MSTMLTTGKVAKRIGKSAKWARKLILNGEFGKIGETVLAQPWEGAIPGITYLVPESAVDAYLKRRDRSARGVMSNA